MVCSDHRFLPGRARPSLQLPQRRSALPAGACPASTPKTAGLWKVRLFSLDSWAQPQAPGQLPVLLFPQPPTSRWEVLSPLLHSQRKEGCLRAVFIRSWRSPWLPCLPTYRQWVPCTFLFPWTPACERRCKTAILHSPDLPFAPRTRSGLSACL